MSTVLSRAAVCQLVPARVGDIAPIFNLIQQGACDGVFNARYVEPRFQAGLGIQLFSACLLGKVRLPNKMRHRTSLLVLRVEGVAAGFVWLVHDHPETGASEIYMCALNESLRGQGYGRWLVTSALDTLPKARMVQAACLPNAQAMQSLLATLGFMRTGRPDASNDVDPVSRYRRCL